jgi:hypothetical protein
MAESNKELVVLMTKGADHEAQWITLYHSTYEC